LIEPGDCQVLATYAKDFYSGRPAMTMHSYGLGKAIYIGTQSHQHFYTDLVVWLRQICNLHPLLKVPDTVEVSLRQKTTAASSSSSTTRPRHCASSFINLCTISSPAAPSPAITIFNRTGPGPGRERGH